jgi:tight adherence protein B
MVKRLLVLVAVISVASAASAAARADSGDGFVHLTPIGRLRAPEHGFLLDLPPAAQLARPDVRLFENGTELQSFTITPIQAVTARFGAILVLDASQSMRGAPEQAALGAARAFVRRIGPSVQVGVVGFNSRSTVLATPGADGSALSAALSRQPRLAYGTHIYDALGTALQQLADTKLTSGSVVLLSDGADTGSKLKEAQLLERANRQHVRIFVVGLHSKAFRPQPLRRLAAATNGSYFEASSIAQLGSIYTELGRRLSTEYVIGYRSAHKPGTHVSVVVRLAGLGDVHASYVTASPKPIAPFSRSLFERFWSSPASLGLVVLFITGLAALAVFLVVRGQEGTLLRRVSEFVSVAAPAEEPARRAPITTKVLAGAEESLAKTKWWAQFNEELEIGRVPIPAAHIVFGTTIATLLVGLVLFLIQPIFVLFALGVPFLARELVRRKLRSVRDDFAEQLPDNLQVLASALRAGHSFVGALSVVAADAPEPAQREFRRVVADDQLGVPIDDSLREVARRMDSSELEQVGLLAELQRESGGNMAEVLETVVQTIRERFDLRRLIQTLTAQGRMARWILSLLPVFLALLITLLNPTYMAPLFNTTLGQVLITIATAMVVTGSLVIKRIVDIKV